MKSAIIVFFTLFPFLCFCQVHSNIKPEYPSTKITWVKNLTGDFSFTENWEFPLGVETKADGKAGCADGGFCPERCYSMLDSKGIVIKDSTEIFYRLLDTTHIPFSIESDAWCYEYAGTNIVMVTKKRDTVFAITSSNIATHSSLELLITNDTCIPSIHLVSIMNDGDAIFTYKKGTIKIDEPLFKKNILKTEFDFEFDNTFEPDKKMYWKGKIYTPIKSEN